MHELDVDSNIDKARAYDFGLLLKEGEQDVESNVRL